MLRPSRTASSWVVACAVAVVGPIACSSGGDATGGQDGASDAPFDAAETFVASDAIAEADVTDVATDASDVAPCHRGDVVFTDGEFVASDWTVSSTASNVCGSSATGTAAYTPTSTGGNPGAYAAVTLTFSSPTCTGGVSGMFLRKVATYTPSTQGPIASIDFSIDRRSKTYSAPQLGFFAVQGTTKLTEPVTTDVGDWTRHTKTFLADALSSLDVSDKGGPITFGFYEGYGTVGSATVNDDVDNWSVTVHPVACP